MMEVFFFFFFSSKIYRSIVSGSTSEVIPQIGIQHLKKPILGATSGPVMGLNDLPTETHKSFSSRDSTDEGTRTGA